MLRLPPPRSLSPYFSIDKPLTSRQLAHIRNQLSLTFVEEELQLDLVSRTAAVLIPLCNVNGRPGILYEVRGRLRHHAGEVRSALHVYECVQQLSYRVRQLPRG